MKFNLIAGFATILLLTSCNKNKKMMDSLADYNIAMETTGYHFGDKLQLPKEVTENAKSITISFMQGESSSLAIDPKFFSLGDNKVVFVIKAKNGETFNQDATINVFTKGKEKNGVYQIVADYPHNPDNFIEGFLLEGNTVYESDGLEKESQLIKYTLGSTVPSVVRKQPDDVFSEGCTIVGDKVYQLTYRNKIGFVYNKNTLEKLSEFPLPNVIGEGWGLTYDGKNLVATDGSKYLYFLDVNMPSKVVKTVGVAGNAEIYEHLNELEYHKGFIYANIWHKPVIIKIDPMTGEVVEKYDFTKLTDENNQGDSEHVLNGIAFKGDNMLLTGKNWTKIYEVAIK
ncbi:glutaminyl-peptide cyclotransferase [Chryseobacterium pennae]|uniref:glutaminyl-peptide cyclotransferase n=1 Tax=Chryseobacterium pennae TaxID=2258962 RepID=UPI0037449444